MGPAGTVGRAVQFKTEPYFTQGPTQRSSRGSGFDLILFHQLIDRSFGFGVDFLYKR